MYIIHNTYHVYYFFLNLDCVSSSAMHTYSIKHQNSLFCSLLWWGQYGISQLILGQIQSPKNEPRVSIDHRWKRENIQETSNHQRRTMTRNLKHEVNFSFEKKKKRPSTKKWCHRERQWRLANSLLEFMCSFIYFWYLQREKSVAFHFCYFS